MILKLFTLYDRATQAYGRPMFLVATGQAIRSFTDEVNNSQSDLFKHPGDFELHELGEYDDSDASFDLHSPKLVATGDSVKLPASQAA